MDAKTPIEHAGSGRKKNRPRRTPKGRQVELQALEVVRAPCMGACDRAPVCAVGHVQVMRADENSVASAASKNAHAHAHRPQVDLAAYQAEGGYTLLRDCIAGKRTRDDIIKIVSDAG